MRLNRSFTTTLTDPSVEENYYTAMDCRSQVVTTLRPSFSLLSSPDLRERPYEDLETEAGSWPPNRLFVNP